MLIDEQHLRLWIERFYGYGHWTAPFWFVAHEEGGGDLPEEVAEKSRYFFDTHRADEGPVLSDLRQLYKHVAFRAEGKKSATIHSLYDYRFGSDATLHGLWKNLISFAHGYRGVDDPDLLAYQQIRFASQQSHEALLRLFPLPSPHNHAWYYGWLEAPSLSFIRNRQQYQAHLFNTRITTIIQAIQHYRPQVVLMYGMSNINDLKSSFQKCFDDVKFKQAKAEPRKLPQHHYARTGSTNIIITTQMPTLRHNRIETGFDWHLMGRLSSSY